MMGKPSQKSKSIFLKNFVLLLHLFACFDFGIWIVWSNGVQIPLWNSVLAKTPAAEYPPKWPLQWMRRVDGQMTPSIPPALT
jgi:hypothetical protein